MKKALKFLGVAAVAALLLAGCQTGTTSDDTSLKTGTANHDFNGKTLVQTSTVSYITKTVTTTVNATGASTTVVTKIPRTIETDTIVFGSDSAKTFTGTISTVYAPTADGDYRATTTTNATTTVDIDYGTYDEVYAGLAGLPAAATSTYSGSWSSVDQLQSATDGYTLRYYVTYATYSTTTANPVRTTSTVTAPTNGTSTTKYTYAAATDSTIITNAYTSTNSIAYTLVGKTTDGKEIYDISTSNLSGVYTQQ